ncbi:MAG TPA: hypothetical protein DCR40_02435 [Prolixibacteraceae bacterium]|nr:hypothetical protein [Prolixibacteraceae bacterium]
MPENYLPFDTSTSSVKRSSGTFLPPPLPVLPEFIQGSLSKGRERIFAKATFDEPVESLSFVVVHYFTNLGFPVDG